MSSIALIACLVSLICEQTLDCRILKTRQFLATMSRRCESIANASATGVNHSYIFCHNRHDWCGKTARPS